MAAGPGRLLSTLADHTLACTAVAVSPDGRHIVSGSWDKTVKVWDLASGACVRTLEGHSIAVTSVAVSSDGRHIVSGSYDKTVKVWDGKHYRRVPHVLIRSRVQSTHATPTEGSLREQQLLHFVYGCNTAEDAALGRRVLPHGTFPRVVKFLTG